MYSALIPEKSCSETPRASAQPFPLKRSRLVPAAHFTRRGFHLGSFNSRAATTGNLT